MTKKEEFHVIKLKKERCKSCGKPIADSLLAGKLGIDPRSGYAIYNDHCAYCADRIMKNDTRKRLKYLIGAKIVAFENDRFDLTMITITKGTRKWTLRGEYQLRIISVEKKKKARTK